MIAACIYQESCKAKWLEVFQSNNFAVLQQVMDILQNTLDQELLERVLTLVAILICIPSFLPLKLYKFEN